MRSVLVRVLVRCKTYDPLLTDLILHGAKRLGETNILEANTSQIPYRVPDSNEPCVMPVAGPSRNAVRKASMTRCESILRLVESDGVPSCFLERLTLSHVKMYCTRTIQ